MFRKSPTKNLVSLLNLLVEGSHGFPKVIKMKIRTETSSVCQQFGRVLDSSISGQGLVEMVINLLVQQKPSPGSSIFTVIHKTVKYNFPQNIFTEHTCFVKISLT